jgi:hypothetical protein
MAVDGILGTGPWQKMSRMEALTEIRWWKTAVEVAPALLREIERQKSGRVEEWD